MTVPGSVRLSGGSGGVGGSGVRLRPRTRELLSNVWVEAKWRQMSEDPERFFRECVFIPAPGQPTGRQTFDLFDYQQDTMRVLDSNRFVVILKARQLGLTTLLMARALHELMHRPGSNILLVSENQRVANKALTLLDFMWRFLPDWYKGRAPVLEVDSATEHIWRFADGLTSRIVSLPATKTAGASETATLVMWDEAALASDQEETFKTLKPTTDAGGRMVVFSTARGGHNRFARLYQGGVAGKNEFATVFHPWYRSRFLNPKAALVDSCEHGPCPECVERVHYNAKKAEFEDNPWEFFSEYPESPDEAFLQSGRPRFPDLPAIQTFDDLGWRGWIRDGQLVEDVKGPLRLGRAFTGGVPSWAETVIGVDPSGGVGGDFTAMQIGFLDRDGVPHRIGFWHDNQIEATEAADQLAELGLFFAGGRQRGALIAVERAGGWGDTFINELQRHHKYPNLYVYRRTGSRKGGGREASFGFPMTANRRPLVIDKLASYLPSTSVAKPIVLQGIDPLLRHELGAFIVTEQERYEADTGMHDDLVLSTGIMLYVLDELGAPATVSAGVENGSGVQRISVAHIFREAEEARLRAEKLGRGEGRVGLREKRR